MKKLIFFLVLLANPVFAETWFEMPNKGGGKIILLMTKCSDGKDGRIVIATSPEGANSTGCWWYFANMVHVAWNDGSIRTSSFEPSYFVQRDDGR